MILQMASTASIVDDLEALLALPSKPFILIDIMHEHFLTLPFLNIMEHGRWKTSAAKILYLGRDLSVRRRVS